jgi:hypothetical protein
MRPKVRHLLFFALAISVPARAADPTPNLARAIASYDDLQPEAAGQELRAVLAANPEPRITATAHIYLGLIAMTFSNDVTAARKEFTLATQADPTASLPMMAAPKVRMVFEQVQAAVLQQGAPKAPPPLEPSAVVLEPASPPLEASAVEKVGLHRTLVPAFATGGLAVAALGAGIVCGALSNQALSQAQLQTVSMATTNSLTGQYTGERVTADVLFGTSLAAAIASTVFLVWGLSPVASAAP